MKYYLKNISSLICRQNSNYIDLFEYIFIKNIKEDYELICWEDTPKEIINWLNDKEIHTEKTNIVSGSFVEILGLHVFLTEEDEEFLFYIKLKYPQILER